MGHRVAIGHPATRRARVSVTCAVRVKPSEAVAIDYRIIERYCDLHLWRATCLAFGYGDPTRRAVFDRLRDAPGAVGDLARELPVSWPAVSQHLRVLKDAGLVRDEQVGTRRFYRVDPVGLMELRAYIDSFWSNALARFKEAVERDEYPPRSRPARRSRGRR